MSTELYYQLSADKKFKRCSSVYRQGSNREGSNPGHSSIVQGDEGRLIRLIRRWGVDTPPPCSGRLAGPVPRVLHRSFASARDVVTEMAGTGEQNASSHSPGFRREAFVLDADARTLIRRLATCSCSSLDKRQLLGTTCDLWREQLWPCRRPGRPGDGTGFRTFPPS